MVGGQENGVGKIEGGVINRGREAKQLVAILQLVLSKTILLATEDDAYSLSLGGVDDLFDQCVSRCSDFTISTTAVRGAHHETAGGDRLRQAGKYLTPVQDLSRPMGNPSRV